MLVSVLGRWGTGGAPAEEEDVDVGAEDDSVGAEVGCDITGQAVSK